MKFFLIIVLFANVVSSQNYSEHKWKNRVIVISADETYAESIEEQLNHFKNKKKQLRERKLVVYKCIGSNCYYYNWVNKPQSFMIKNLPKRFSIELISLDGNKKFESNSIVKSEDIFDLIDTMPMRRRELKKKQ